LEDELITRKWVGYMALMNEKRNGKSNRKESLEDLCTDGRII